MPEYLTIKSDFIDETVIKKSRFIASLKRITSESDALDFIAANKKLHNKANHNCYAFMLGSQDQIQRASDDGEPSGTAGVPILEVLKRNEIHDVCVIVTRYFGGIKLGAGGLIRAYAGSAANAIEAVGLIERLLMRTITLTIQYNQLDTLNHWLQQHNYPTPTIEYGADVQVTLPIQIDDCVNFENNITELLSGKVTFELGEESFQEIDYIRS